MRRPSPPVVERDLRDEALHGRLLPGDGALPLRAALAAVPDVPLSVELRSAALMTRYPDPTERARAVRSACAAPRDVYPRRTLRQPLEVRRELEAARP